MLLFYKNIFKKELLVYYLLFSVILGFIAGYTSGLFGVLVRFKAPLLPFLFINKMYSTETVGYLDLSKLVLSVPLVFISSTISQVLFQQITSKKHDSLSIKGDFKNVFLVLISVISLELMVIVLFGPWLFGFAFGLNYELSGKFSQILIFSFALHNKTQCLR